MSEKPIERFTMRYIFHSLLNIFNLEKGLFHTIYQLIIHPGKALRSYLFEDRTHFMKPFSFLLLSITLAVIALINIQHIEKGLEKQLNTQRTEQLNRSPQDDKEEKIQRAFNIYIQQASIIYSKYLNVLLILFIPIVSIFSYLFFRKDKMYYAEHLIANSYIMSMQNLIYLLMLPIFFLVSMNAFMVVYLIFSVAYHVYTYLHLFSYRPLPNIFRSLMSICIGYLVYMIISMLVFAGVFLYIYVFTINDAGA